MDDLISRQAAIELIERMKPYHQGADDIAEMIANMPSAQPEPSEITDEQAIMHLQSTGWMQNHDREMYESGLREQLADDSDDYDSLIPCEDAVSRQTLQKELALYPIDDVTSEDEAGYNRAINDVQKMVLHLPSAQPKSEERTAESAQNVTKEDLISRKAAIDAVKGLPTWWADAGGYYGGAQPPMTALLDPEDTVAAIDNMPSAQPERKTGKWIQKGLKWECDQCGCRIGRAKPFSGNMWNYYYCPNCGVKMEEGEQDGQTN